MPRKKRSENNIDTIDSFYSDVIKEGTLYATIVRCPFLGPISSFNIPEMPEGYFFFDAKDIPGKNYIITNGIKIPIFANQTVSYKGEPVGVVVGKEKNQISKIISQMEIQLDEKSMLDALSYISEKFYSSDKTKNALDTASSTKVIAERAIKIGTIIEDSENSAEQNTCDSNENEILSEPQTNDGKGDEFSSDKKSDKKIEKISVTSKMRQFVPNWLETNGAYCFWKNGEYTIYTGTNCPENLKTDLSNVLDIPEENIAIKKTKASDCTDGLWRTTIFSAIASLAAMKTEKPVMLTLDRSEENQFIPQYAQTEILHEAYIEETGKIVSLKTDIKVDVGAFNPYAQIIVDRLAIASCNMYQFENAQISVTASTSENPPTGLPAHKIDTPAFFAIENLMNKIALKKKLLPLDVKEINCQKTESMFLCKPQRIKSVYNALVPNYDKHIPDTEFNVKYIAFNRSNKLERGKLFKFIPLRGIGIACAFNGSDYADGIFSSKTQQVEISIDKEDNIVVHSFLPLNEMKLFWNSVIEKELGIPKNKIKYEKCDDFGSISILTELFEKCVSDIKKRRKTEKEFPIVCKRKKQPISKTQWNTKKFAGNPFYETSFGGTVVELQVDKYTKEITIKNIFVAVDCGKVISEAVAVRSIKLAISKDLSNLVKGKIFSCDNISISMIKSDFSPSAIADIVHNTLPAAFASALSNALGRDIHKLPFSFDNRL